jgi:tripartite-type tricarboxylate transporter receptor subunit TctC
MWRALSCAFASLLICATAAAQPWPGKPIRIVVPFAPGGATDVPARLIAPKLTEALGQPVVVENRPGAGGIIGIDSVAKSPADGYTFVMASNGELVMNASIYPKLPYSPFKDLVPVSIAVESPLVLVVSPSSPFKSVADVIAAAKARPGSVSYATAGVGSTSHVLTEMFAQRAGGLKLLHAAYKGGAPASNAIVSGEVAFGLLNLGSASALMSGGRVRGLAVTSAARVPDFPSTPTFIESGVPDFTDGIWVGLAAPTGVPQDIVRRMSSEVAKALQSPDVQTRTKQIGVHAVGSSPEEAAARIQRELPRYSEAIRQADIRAE